MTPNRREALGTRSSRFPEESCPVLEIRGVQSTHSGRYVVVLAKSKLTNYMARQRMLVVLRLPQRSTLDIRISMLSGMYAHREKILFWREAVELLQAILSSAASIS